MVLATGRRQGGTLAKDEGRGRGRHTVRTAQIGRVESLSGLQGLSSGREIKGGGEGVEGGIVWDVLCEGRGAYAP